VICVVADDLTGAAELGGVALRHGLAAEVQLKLSASADAGLICASTDSRSCTPSEAARRAANAADLCRSAEFTDVFKKVDSVLRGWVVVELAALMRGLGKERALLVPANPSKSRTIEDGRYLINGQPLNRTEFSLDPEHPVRSSQVLSLASMQPAGPNSDEFPPVFLLPPGSSLPSAGICVGEASSPADLIDWADKADDTTLPAGAAEFFAALLVRRGFESAKRARAATTFVPPQRALFVCGSTSDASRSFLRFCEERGLAVLRMPPGLFEASHRDEELMAQWAAATVQALADCSRAVVAIDRPLRREPGLPLRLGERLGEVVRRILKTQAVDAIFAEGGATTTALAQALSWSRLVAQGELGPGVVSMRAPGESNPLLVIKPGSYPWPQQVLALCRSRSSREV
jgi:uncharacterized protein YgbK (DUF1537 family)